MYLHAATLPAESEMENVVVTATREGKDKRELAESVSVATEMEIEAVAPSHPAEILNRMAGVHINNLGGEGHMASIRQPITTAGVYLFLEEGVPTRPTGYFNHNGLYEVNIPQSSRLEVSKGPGSALYGSDAIGGIINSVTKPSPTEPELMINAEAGASDWRRGLISAGDALSDNTGIRVDLNVTDSEGYRDDAAYERYSTTVRLDHKLNDRWDSKTILSYSQVDQSGSSSLEEDDYRNNARKNHYTKDIGYREVEALRLHSEFATEIDDRRLVTITPYFRDNSMKMMPSWMITYDPNVRDYKFQSYGAMFKYRELFANGNGQWIAGFDVDYTPSTYEELAIDDPSDVQNSTTDGRLTAGANGVYSDYALTGVSNYDFDTDQTTISPYVHAEWDIGDRWLLSAGLRYDNFTVDYSNNLQGQTQDVSSHNRLDSGELSFDKFSPKLSAIYYINERHNIYANYRQGFRAPTIGNLYRSGSSEQTDKLEAVKLESAEIGFRGQFDDALTGGIISGLQYELALYEMRKTDDIVTVVGGNTRLTVNAGETTHRGIELAVNADLSESVSMYFSWTATTQRYDDFAYIYGYFQPGVGFVSEERNYGGSDIARAPREFGNINIRYSPVFIPGLSAELEYEKVGRYYTDETNELSYGGHELFNLRLNYKVNDSTAVYARLMNLTDRKYSTYTSAQVGDADSSYRPGTPRAAFVGFRYNY